MVCTADGFGLLRRMIPYNLALLFCLAAAVEKGHDLRSCAVVAGAEQAAADTAGDLVLLRPRNCLFGAILINCFINGNCMTVFFVYRLALNVLFHKAF